jgi:serine protease Do
MKGKLILSALVIFFCYTTQSYCVDTTNDVAILKRTSKAFTNVGKKAIPAAVFIKSQFTTLANANNPSIDDYENPFDYFNDEFFRHFFGSPRGFNHSQQPQMAGGSGCIVSKDGYILTNCHVVKDATKITVVLNNGDEYEAKIIGTDPRTDLAVLKITAPQDLPFLTFGNSDKLEVGEWAIAIGSPFALQATLTVGIISAKGRQDLKITDLGDFIQTDAAINPGNSGGPLLNIDAQVIGINTAIVSQSGGYMGIGFAIPSNMAKHVMEQIIATGSVKRGYLGVYIQDIDKQMAETLGLKKAEGLLITEIVKNSAAEKAGLQQGDIILECNKVPVKNSQSFKNEIALMDPNKQLELKIIRDDKTIIIKANLETSPEEVANVESSPLGLEVAELKDVQADILKKYGYTTNMEGLIITKIKRGSIAEQAGLKLGMLIIQVNQKNIKTKLDFQEALNKAKDRKHLLLLVKYQNITRFISIKLN